MRVLFLTQRLPFAPNRGDRVRAYHMVRTLVPHVELEVVSFAHDDGEAEQVDAVRSLGARATAVPLTPVRNYAAAVAGLPGSRPLTHYLLNAPEMSTILASIASARRPDLVFAYCTGVARFAVEPPLAGIPLVVDFVDVDSRKWATLADTASPVMKWVYRREARLLGRFERTAATEARTNLVVNDRERDALLEIAPAADVRVIENGVDLTSLRRPNGDDSPAVTFCGVMNYAPNVDAVLWFAKEVWPLVRASQPSARFIVVGSDPTPAVRQLASTENGIEVTGAVADVKPYLWSAAVSVAPLRTARGIQNKVLEALAAGLPAVVTGQVMDGLPVEVRDACRVADAPRAFAQEMLALLALDAPGRRAVAARARLEGLTWESQLAALPEILKAALSSARR